MKSLLKSILLLLQLWTQRVHCRQRKRWRICIPKADANSAPGWSIFLVDNELPHRERRWSTPIPAPQAEQVLLFSLLSDSRRASPSLAGSGSSELSKAAAPAAQRGAEPQQGQPTQGPAALRAKMLIGLPGIKDNLFSSVQTHSFMGQLLPFTKNVFGGEE